MYLYFSGLSQVSLSECVMTEEQWDQLASTLATGDALTLQHLNLATVFVLEQDGQSGLWDTAKSHKLAEALSRLSELSVRIVLKRDRFEGYLDSRPGLFLELFKKIDQNPSPLTALDLDSQVLKDIPSDLFSSSLAKIEKINLTEANVTTDQVASLVSLNWFNAS